MKAIVNKPRLRVGGKKGFVLVATLWSLALFGTVVVITSWSVQGTVNEAASLSTRAEAEALADGALYLSIYRLLQSRSFSRSELSGAEQITDLDGRVVATRVQDETGKLNLLRTDPGLLRLVLGSVLACSDHREEITEALMDWRAGKTLRRQNDQAGGTKFRDFLDFDELREIGHMTPRLLERLQDIFTLYTRRPLDIRLTPEPLRAVLGEYSLVAGGDADQLLNDPETISGSGLYSLTAGARLENGAAFTRYATVQIDLREGGRYRLLRWSERSDWPPDEFDRCEG